MTKNNKIELRRVSINLPSNLVDRVKEYGDSLGLNTTSAYIVLLNQALDQKDTMAYLPLIPELLTLADKAKESELGTKIDND